MQIFQVVLSMKFSIQMSTFYWFTILLFTTFTDEDGENQLRTQKKLKWTSLVTHSERQLHKYQKSYLLFMFIQNN